MSSNDDSIVVGIDDSEHTKAAARWAGALAARLGVSLRLVHVMRPVDEALLVLTSGEKADAGEYPRELGRQLIDRAAAAVSADVPGLRISRTLSHRSPEEVLVDVSRNARLLVVAPGDVSRVGALLAGSTTLTLAAKASCPVVAWRGDDLAPTAAPIVVGVDGDDEGSRAALLTAFGLADRLGAEVVVVHAMPPHQAPGEVNIPIMIDWQKLESAALQQLSAVVKPMIERWPHINVTYDVEAGAPGPVILRQSKVAQLVVVGSRRRGNLASALLGSTGLHLLHHSAVPVLLCPATTST